MTPLDLARALLMGLLLWALLILGLGLGGCASSGTGPAATEVQDT